MIISKALAAAAVPVAVLMAIRRRHRLPAVIATAFLTADFSGEAGFSFLVCRMRPAVYRCLFPQLFGPGFLFKVPVLVMLQPGFSIMEVLVNPLYDGRFLWNNDHLIAFPAVSVDVHVTVVVGQARLHSLSDSPFHIGGDAFRFAFTKNQALFLFTSRVKAAKACNYSNYADFSRNYRITTNNSG